MVLFLNAVFLIKFHPQIIDSLLAIKIFLLFFVNSIVGFNPAIPGMAAIVISDLVKKKSLISKLLKIFIFFFFIFFFYFMVSLFIVNNKYIWMVLFNLFTN